jgi:TRAP-type transport system periplasmic protein
MITLRFGGYQPSRSVHTRGLRALAATVGRHAVGELAIEVTENIAASGHKAGDLFELVANGDLDGCYFASSYLTGRVPALAVLDLPFYSPSRAAVFAALDGAGGELLSAAVAARTPYRVLGHWDNGIRHISNRLRPINGPADCAGLRLRTLDSALHQAAFRQVGFIPEFIDVAGLTRAVAEQVVDAQENPLTNMVNFGLQAYHRHVSLTGQRGLAIEEDAECVAFLAEAGIIPVAQQAIDLRAFQKAVAGVVDAAANTIEPELRRAFFAA